MGVLCSQVARTDGKTAEKIKRGGYKTTLHLIIGSPEHSTKEGRKSNNDGSTKKSKEDSNTIYDRPRKGAPDMDIQKGVKR